MVCLFVNNVTANEKLSHPQRKELQYIGFIIYIRMSNNIITDLNAIFAYPFFLVQLIRISLTLPIS